MSTSTAAGRRTVDRAETGRSIVAVAAVAMASKGIARLVIAAFAVGGTEARVALSDAAKWLALVLALCLVSAIERRSGELLRMHRLRRREIGAAIAIAPVLVAVNVAASSTSTQSSHTLYSLAALSTPAKMSVVITAAVTEEILHRGLLLERMLRFGHPVAAVAA